MSPTRARFRRNARQSTYNELMYSVKCMSGIYDNIIRVPSQVTLAFDVLSSLIVIQ